ncbi:MAG TPA: hypothetical protein VNO70_12195 [Blastocatellia bacterium]|nr:hypothetical protein [Blastocatellia bacterium]
MPPHRGHQFLIEYARSRADHLTVIIFTKSHEPMPGSLRAEWMRQLFPEVSVLHVTEEHPMDFGDPAIWDLWIAAIRKVYPEGPDFVFSSEEYGEELARRLGAQHITVDPDRRQVPVSATMIRERPFAYWDFIPPPVRDYFARMKKE